MPYVTASIIVQLMTVVIPRLEQLQKEGEAGYAKINQYTRYLTVALAAAQVARLRVPLRAPGRARHRTPAGSCCIVITLTVGCTVLMWTPRSPPITRATPPTRRGWLPMGRPSEL